MHQQPNIAFFLHLILHSMKKFIIYWLSIVSAFAFVWCSTQEPVSTTTPKGTATITQTSSPSIRLASSNYISYSEKALTDAQNEWKDVIVFFHSKTCGSCKKADTDINTNISDIPSNVVILKADWDDNQALANKFDVQSYHTYTYFRKDWTQENISWLFTLQEIIQNIS